MKKVWPPTFGWGAKLSQEQQNQAVACLGSSGAGGPSD
nr:MAG TPA: hypothetical protein [Caudoviricetes sp.]